MPHKLNNISRQDTRYAALMTNVKLFSHLFFAFNIAFGVRRQQILGLLNYFILLILIGQTNLLQTLTRSIQILLYFKNLFLTECNA